MNMKRTRSGSRKPEVGMHEPAPAPIADATRDQMALELSGDEISSRLFVEVESESGSNLSVEATPAVTESLPFAAAEAIAPLAPAFLPAAASVPAAVTGPLGSRLRAAREARGLAPAEVARQLRIPEAKVAEMEAESFGEHEISVFMRGYLKSYARLLELPQVIVASALAQFDAAMPALVATQTVSRSHYLASRYGNSLVYIVLTAVVVVPLLWMARQGSLMPSAATPRMESLDTAASVALAPAAGESDDSISASPAAIAQGQSASPDVADAAEPVASSQSIWGDFPPQPVRAAMAPMPESPSVGMQRVVLTLTQPSWIEFTGADGRRIEYALLPEGTRREYQVSGSASLRIGNTRGASLEVDGSPLGLAPYTVANVALVTLGGAAEGANPR